MLRQLRRIFLAGIFIATVAAIYLYHIPILEFSIRVWATNYFGIPSYFRISALSPHELRVEDIRIGYGPDLVAEQASLKFDIREIIENGLGGFELDAQQLELFGRAPELKEQSSIVDSISFGALDNLRPHLLEFIQQPKTSGNPIVDKLSIDSGTFNIAAPVGVLIGDFDVRWTDDGEALVTVSVGDSRLRADSFDVQVSRLTVDYEASRDGTTEVNVRLEAPDVLIGENHIAPLNLSIIGNQEIGAAVRGQLGEPNIGGIQIASVEISGDVEFQRQNLEFNADLSVPSLENFASATVNFDLTSLEGGIEFVAKGLEIGNEFQLTDLLPNLASEMPISNLIATLDALGSAELSGSKFKDLRATLHLSETSFESEIANVQGLEANLSFSNLSPLTAEGLLLARAQQIDIQNIGLSDAEAAFRIDTDLGVVYIEETSVAAFDGDIQLSPSTYNYQQNSLEASLRFSQISLDELLDLAGENVSGSGRLGGELPFSLAEGEINVKEGRIRSEGAGNIDYLGDVPMLRDKLKNLKFNKVVASVDGSVFDELEICAHFDAIKPGTDNDPFFPKVSLSGPIYALFERAFVEGRSIGLRCDERDL